MKVYQRRETHLGKWIVATLAFIIVMTMTFADVYGIATPSKPGDGNGKNGSQEPPKGQMNNQSDMSTQQTPDPSPVPEPSTMILMALGLGAAAVARKSKKA